MRRGDLAAAWAINDELLATRRGIPCHQWPRHLQNVWDGTPVEDRRVLVRCYHGLGDTLMFARYFPLLQRRARELTIWAQPALIPLLATMGNDARLLPLHDGDPGTDAEVELESMELPYLFRTTLATIPASVPYLHVGSPTRVRQRAKRTIGLVWSAGDWEQERRSIPFPVLRPLASVRAVDWHILQRGPALAARPAGFGLVTGSDDILAAARLIRGLDLVITVDTMVAHLAGALGVPTWVLLDADTNWRWLSGRADSPWYPTLRLFRQSRAGNWGEVIEQVVAELSR